MPLQDGKIGDRVMVHGRPGTIKEVTGTNEYMCWTDDKRKVVAEGRHMNFILPPEGPKSDKNVKLK